MRFFSLPDLTRTHCADLRIQAIQANPPPQIVAHLERLVDTLLDPCRTSLGALHVNSGWRCPELNALQPMASLTSMHLQGLAADLVPLQIGPMLAMRWIVESDLPYDQVIFERHSSVWIHVGAAADDAQPRLQALMMLGPVMVAGKLKPVYQPWNPTDPRLS
jgi:hypothetical protein